MKEDVPSAPLRTSVFWAVWRNERERGGLGGDDRRIWSRGPWEEHGGDNGGDG